MRERFCGGEGIMIKLYGGVANCSQLFIRQLSDNDIVLYIPSSGSSLIAQI